MKNAPEDYAMQRRFEIACSCRSLLENIKPNEWLFGDVFFEDDEDCEADNADD